MQLTTLWHRGLNRGVRLQDRIRSLGCFPGSYLQILRNVFSYYQFLRVGFLALCAALLAFPLSATAGRFSLMTADGREHTITPSVIERIQQEAQDTFAQAHYFHGVRQSDFVGRDNAHKVTLQTGDGYALTGYYFDRGSDTVFVVGPGAWGSAVGMRQFVHLTEGYDLFLCTFRWHPVSSYLMRRGRIFRPYKALFFDAIRDVETILHWVREQKAYRQVIGLGQCYSAWLFVMTQAHLQSSGDAHAFTKLILDSCGLSLHAFAEQAVRNPWLMWTGGRGDSPRLVRWFLERNTVNRVVQACTKRMLKDIKIADYLSRISDTPILFVQGTSDKLVRCGRFADLFAAAELNPHLAFMTPYGHLLHSVKTKELYRALISAFADESSMDDVVTRFELPAQEPGSD